MFVRHVRRLEAIRAQRLLDQIQVRAVTHMADGDRGAFIDRLVAAASGEVREADGSPYTPERVIWNGTVLHTTREIKQMAFAKLERGLVAA